MPDGFNMVTAMETIHRHIHAVGCGALPSCWMTGDPSFFCRADGLFVPSLAVLLRFAVLRVDDVFGLRHRRLQSVIPLRCAEPHEPHAPHEPRLLGYIIGGLHVFIG